LAPLAKVLMRLHLLLATFCALYSRELLSVRVINLCVYQHNAPGVVCLQLGCCCWQNLFDGFYVFVAPYCDLKWNKSQKNSNAKSLLKFSDFKFLRPFLCDIKPVIRTVNDFLNT